MRELGNRLTEENGAGSEAGNGGVFIQKYWHMGEYFGATAAAKRILNAKNRPPKHF